MMRTIISVSATEMMRIWGSKLVRRKRLSDSELSLVISLVRGMSMVSGVGSGDEVLLVLLVLVRVAGVVGAVGVIGVV